MDSSDDVDLSQLIICHECDLVHYRMKLSPGQVARCVRCGNRLYDVKVNGIRRALALTVTSLVLFVLANVYPFMTFSRDGIEQITTLLGGVGQLREADMVGLALVVGFVALAAPLLQILGLLYVLVPAVLAKRPWKRELSLRILEFLRPWGMIEIFMLGSLVALVKLQAYAKIEIGVAFVSFAALVITMSAAASHVDPEDLFEAAELEQ